MEHDAAGADLGGEPDPVVVVGAGIAGLAAAGRLRAAGVATILIEAEPCIGGRASTLFPPELGGHAFDLGAQWLHAAETNPLVPVCRAAGERVATESPAGVTRICRGDGSEIPPEAYETGAESWRQALRARLDGPDISLAAAGPDDLWTATVEAWEATIIAAADADRLSLRDWNANALEGSNFVPASGGGLGAMLARVLGPPAGSSRTGVRATAIAARPDGVRVETSSGTIEAAAAIVTVSTGVLRAGGIRFSPALPDATAQAIDGLPMGALTKIALPAAGEGRLGFAAGADLFRCLARRGETFFSTLFWPGGAPYCVGFVGGSVAASLAGKPAEAIAMLRAELCTLLGQGAGRALLAEGVVAGWVENPHFGGAYAYARPGCAGARAVLREPVWEGRLRFAGEALAPDGMAGTVGGAYASGVGTAEALLAAPPFLRSRAAV